MRRLRAAFSPGCDEQLEDFALGTEVATGLSDLNGGAGVATVIAEIALDIALADVATPGQSLGEEEVPLIAGSEGLTGESDRASKGGSRRVCRGRLTLACAFVGLSTT
jgi:hypothetical protein